MTDLFKVEIKEKSFALDPMEEEHMAFKSKESATEIWHKRLGRFHLLGLLKKLGEGLSDLNDDLTYCRAGKFGKQHRQSFLKQAWRALKKLQVIHINLCGPRRTPSLNSNLYYIALLMI